MSTPSEIKAVLDLLRIAVHPIRNLTLWLFCRRKFRLVMLKKDCEDLIDECLDLLLSHIDNEANQPGQNRLNFALGDLASKLDAHDVEHLMKIVPPGDFLKYPFWLMYVKKLKLTLEKASYIEDVQEVAHHYCSTIKLECDRWQEKNTNNKF